MRKRHSALHVLAPILIVAAFMGGIVLGRAHDIADGLIECPSGIMSLKCE